MPERFFVVRHGERIDHVDSHWAQTSDRPQDPPLTNEGKKMAVRLGQYLTTEHPTPIDPKDCVIYTSPLTRCVESAHHLAEGLGYPVPIILEESLVEGTRWLSMDLKRRREAVEKKSFWPLWHGADHHKASTSPLVQTAQRAPFAAVNIINEPGTHKLRESVDYEVRCAKAVHAFHTEEAKLQNPPKVVFLIGHGASVSAWFAGLMGDSKGGYFPEYTGFAELHRREGTVSRYYTFGHVFGTPHLDAGFE